MATSAIKPFRFIKKNKLVVVLFFLLAIILLGAIFAPWVSPYPPNKQSILNAMKSPSYNHWLGTDSFGRDVFSRVIWGARVSLFIAAVSMGIAAIAGTLVGMCAGYYGKAFDTITNWFVDIMMTFPVLIIGVMIAVMLGSGLIQTIVAIAVAFTPRFIRLARGVTMSIKEETFVKAAITYGQKDYKIIVFHIFPHIVTSIVVMATLWGGVAIGIEASLSFLGLGVQPPTPSWGAMTQEYFTYVTRSMALPLYPGFAIAFTMYVLAILGDKLQDLLNPRIKST
jgi:peptide/nickel transport system permease protein